MRKNQVVIKIDRYGEQSKEGHDIFTIYSDSNNIYEALSGAYMMALEQIGNPSIAKSIVVDNIKIERE